MGKVAERRARVSEEILEAAREVMTESGAAGLSLGEVARRMGMRTPSLYGYFAGRAQLCDEIFRCGWEDYGRLTAHIRVGPGTDLGKLLRGAFLESVTWANENRAAAELMFWRPIPHWQPSAEAFTPSREAVGNVVRILTEAQAHGLLRPDADVLEMAEALGAIVSGVVSQQLSNEPGVDAQSGRISRHAAAFAAMFMSHYGPRHR